MSEIGERLIEDLQSFESNSEFAEEIVRLAKSEGMAGGAGTEDTSDHAAAEDVETFDVSDLTPSFENVDEPEEEEIEEEIEPEEDEPQAESESEVPPAEDPEGEDQGSTAGSSPEFSMDQFYRSVNQADIDMDTAMRMVNREAAWAQLTPQQQQAIEAIVAGYSLEDLGAAGASPSAASPSAPAAPTTPTPAPVAPINLPEYADSETRAAFEALAAQQQTLAAQLEEQRALQAQATQAQALAAEQAQIETHRRANEVGVNEAIASFRETNPMSDTDWAVFFTRARQNPAVWNNFVTQANVFAATSEDSIREGYRKAASDLFDFIQKSDPLYVAQSAADQRAAEDAQAARDRKRKTKAGKLSGSSGRALPKAEPKTKAERDAALKADIAENFEAIQRMTQE